jgi:hypothetical protein
MLRVNELVSDVVETARMTIARELSLLEAEMD